ncbi:hypothetical protein GCM10023259_058580 [Thermocatellispora tengchongensis]
MTVEGPREWGSRARATASKSGNRYERFSGLGLRNRAKEWFGAYEGRPPAPAAPANAGDVLVPYG